jgi:hypothetical protein
VTEFSNFRFSGAPNLSFLYTQINTFGPQHLKIQFIHKNFVNIPGSVAVKYTVMNRFDYWIHDNYYHTVASSDQYFHYDTGR